MYSTVHTSVYYNLPKACKSQANLVFSAYPECFSCTCLSLDNMILDICGHTSSGDIE